MNMPEHKRKEQETLGRGTAGKSAVVGLKGRNTNKVVAQSVNDTEKDTLQEIIKEHADSKAVGYTDDSCFFQGLRFYMKQSITVLESMCGEWRHTNGVESFWRMIKRGYMGTFHHFSKKHLDRYVTEFAGRHNVRPKNTKEPMSLVAHSMVGKRLKYKDVVS